MEFKIGDKVKVTGKTKGDNNEHCFGKKGTITEVDNVEKDPLNIRVKFDKSDFKGYFFRAKDLTAITKALTI